VISKRDLEPRLPTRLPPASRLILSAAAASLVLHAALQAPWIGVLAASVVLTFWLPQWLARQRLKRLLTSGDLPQILKVWDEALEALPHRQTVGPLVRATALAAHGLTDRARGALERAQRGLAWDNALEHRLFIEVLLDAFEGERTQALDKAQVLKALPFPRSPWAEQRARVLRGAALALARAFAHCSERGDVERLKAAAKQHPLVYWAMRYALAVVCIDQGQPSRALELIDGAPRWPEGSAFNAFQAELTEQASVG
jgi:hypothetical protein